MPHNVLMTDATSLLGSYLTALRLASSEDVVFCAMPQTEGSSSEELTTRVRQALAQLMPGEANHIEERIESCLHWITSDFDRNDLGLPDALPSAISIDEIWCLSRVPSLLRRCRTQADITVTRGLLMALPRLGVTSFNYVGTGCLNRTSPGTSGEAPHLKHPANRAFGEPHYVIEKEVAEQCRAYSIDYRIFCTSLLVGEGPSLSGSDYEGFLQFLTALHDLKSEIEERLPEYFDYQALRCWAPADAHLNLIRVEQAAKLILRMAGEPGTLGRSYQVVSPESIRFTDLCERVGLVYDVSLLMVNDYRSLNAVDRLFHERVTGFHTYLTSSKELSGGHTDYTIVLAPEQVLLDEEAQLALFQAVRCRQDAALIARNKRVAGLFASLEQRTIDRDGTELTYYTGGAGKTPIVVLNALGYRLHFWGRLIDSLLQRHRVIIWELRGTISPSPFRIGDQVNDLEAILQQEAIDICDFVCWCNASKIAVEFSLRHPTAVSSIVFLNGTFKCLGSPEELDSDYEHNFEPLCRILESRPKMAASVMNSLQASIAHNPLTVLEETDAERMATSVLSMMNEDLKQHAMEPFQSESSMMNYARQILDFWSYDTKADAGRVRVPTLFIISEYDRIASPTMSRAMAKLFPFARSVQVQGATHYCLYDRPDLIAALIENFLRNPESLNDIDGEVRPVVL